MPPLSLLADVRSLSFFLLKRRATVMLTLREGPLTFESTPSSTSISTQYIMIELIGELNTASGLLQVALDRYLSACSAIRSYYCTQPATLTGVPRTLSDRISNELPSVTSYEASLKQAKSIISQAMNCSADVPIHALPAEILTRIFSLVVGAPCAVKKNSGTSQDTSLSRYPDFISHVCSRWRQIVLGLPVLWSHIDLVYNHSLGQGFADRAEACADRAGDLPLDIHIRTPASYCGYSDKGLYHFLESTTTRARSLELAVPSTLDHFPSQLFEACFKSHMPGTLVEFTITDHNHYTPEFIIAYEDVDDGSDRTGFALYLPEKDFEDLLLPVTNLRLDGIYPPWTSQAYHGLVELRLTSTNRFCITELELYSIFQSSPRLCTLQFSLYIESSGLSKPPVCLEDLAVLSLDTLGYSQLAAFLGLISTGSKPLQLTIKYYGTMSPRSEDKVTKFFMHSNITKLRMDGSHQAVRSEVVPPTPQLRMLVLDRFYGRETHWSSFNPRKDATPPRSLPLEVVYILNSNFDLEDIYLIIEKHPVQAIFLWRSHVSRQGECLDRDAATMELSKFCPVVEYVRSLGPNPVKAWT